MKIRLDRKKCLGCGICVVICPAIFETAEDGKSKARENIKESKKLIQCAENAAEACPVQAIYVIS